MSHFNVDAVIHGTTPVMSDEDDADPYEVPKRLGKFMTVDSGNDMTTEKIVQRIIRNRLEFQERNRIKEQKEIELIKSLQLKDVEV